jgi:hypothetical protein
MNNEDCSVCHNPREYHHQDKDGVWWCCDNISVMASFKIKSNLYQKQEVVLNKPRPIGFNNKPIPNGMLYSDYTPEQVEAACNAPDFEEKCKHAQENSDKMLSLMMIESDRKIDAINRIAQFEEDAGLYDKVLLPSKGKTLNQTSREIVNQITGSLVIPSVGITLTQDEADAIKEYVETRLKDNVQGSVHSGFVRG